MPGVCRALLDVNVILDVFQRRQPFYDDSAAVLAAAETGRLAGLVAAISKMPCRWPPPVSGLGERHSTS